MAEQSSGERAFLHWWNMLSGCPPPPEPELRFAKGIGRQWRFDFAWKDKKVALEIDGGTWKRNKTGHTSGAGYQRDREKDMAAKLLGWCVIRMTPEMLEADPIKCINQIKQVLEMESEGE